MAVSVRKLSIYFQPFRCSSFLKCALQPKIAIINKNPYFGRSGSFKVIDVDTTEKLVTRACCDRQHAHAYLQPFSRKTGQQRYNNDFYGGTAVWCPRAQVSLNLANRDLVRQNRRSMLKISHTAFPCLSQLISAQFALEMCLATRNRQKDH